MQGNWKLVKTGLLVLGLGVCTQAAFAQSAQDELTPVRDVTESVEVERDGQRGTVKVHMQKWILQGHLRIKALKLPGFDGVRILQLAAGEITTVIGGERVDRAEGEWWTVPAGKSLGLVTEDDAAILWAISVDPD